MVDVANRDPNGTIPAFVAARDALGAVSPRFRMTALYAVVRRLLALAEEYVKSSVEPSEFAAAVKRAEEAEGRLARMLAAGGLTAGVTLGGASTPAPVRKRAPRGTKSATKSADQGDAPVRRRSLSPGRPVPKLKQAKYSKSGKRLGRPPVGGWPEEGASSENGNGAYPAQQPVETHIPSEV